jgi:hypothetical protein
MWVLKLDPATGKYLHDPLESAPIKSNRKVIVVRKDGAWERKTINNYLELQQPRTERLVEACEALGVDPNEVARIDWWVGKYKTYRSYGDNLVIHTAVKKEEAERALVKAQKARRALEANDRERALLRAKRARKTAQVTLAATKRALAAAQKIEANKTAGGGDDLAEAVRVRAVVEEYLSAVEVAVAEAINVANGVLGALHYL